MSSLLSVARPNLGGRPRQRRRRLARPVRDLVRDLVLGPVRDLVRDLVLDPVRDLVLDVRRRCRLVSRQRAGRGPWYGFCWPCR